ncbi:MAG: holo-ACP synthase [Leptospirales bacterium]|nr:holo-ACP synthase [Leptospirales bacterium]
MIYGIGVDLAFCGDFREVFEPSGENFLRRYFTPSEERYCREVEGRQRLQRLAARYAAKEALLKALDGPRLHEDALFAFNYQEAEVARDHRGRPMFRFHGELPQRLAELGVAGSHLSLSHSGDYAIAQVALLSRL